jgi:hypothetical protein
MPAIALISWSTPSCGGEVSGIRDISPEELNAVFKRLQSILDTVSLDAK